MAKVDYLLLTQDAIAAQINVDPAEVKQAYDANAKQYTTNEERQASHILIAVKPDASDADKAAAKQKATTLLAKARANPGSFAELAKANSQDPGLRRRREAISGRSPAARCSKPFEDAVFAAKVGDIVGPVQTDFGYHVIKVTGITPAHVQTFDEVKGRIEADVKRQKAAQKFAASADQFQNLVYEQADSLAGAAKALDLKVETTQFVTRAQVQALALGNRQIRAGAVFARVDPEQAQHRSDRSRTERVDGRAHRRIQAGGAAPARPRCGMKFASS